MTNRRRISSGARWETVVGYSRAVRVGPHIWVAGTTALGSDGELVGRGDAYAQARQALGNIEAALRQAGASLADVVRTRIFVRDMADWDDIGRAHGESFGATRPACTMVEVSGLIEQDMLVEIEADAYVTC